tara:strand:+ start:2140 stop:2412 length:273 start_codon:yes stop_codon:yes gene_type:complete
MSLFEAAGLYGDLNDVPVHMRAQVKRARDARRYADIDMPKVGDLVMINYGYHPGKPAVVTYVNPPDIRFVYPDGKEGSSGVRGVKLVSKK